jgi:hypothetical protein
VAAGAAIIIIEIVAQMRVQVEPPEVKILDEQNLERVSGLQIANAVTG